MKYENSIFGLMTISIVCLLVAIIYYLQNGFDLFTGLLGFIWLISGALCFTVIIWGPTEDA
jgi:hypothetical protein